MKEALKYVVAILFFAYYQCAYSQESVDSLSLRCVEIENLLEEGHIALYDQEMDKWTNEIAQLPEGEYTIINNIHLASLYLQAKRNEEALRILKHSLEWAESNLTEEHILHIEILSMLAAVYNAYDLGEAKLIGEKALHIIEHLKEEDISRYKVELQEWQHVLSSIVYGLTCNIDSILAMPMNTLPEIRDKAVSLSRWVNESSVKELDAWEDSIINVITETANACNKIIDLNSEADLQEYINICRVFANICSKMDYSEGSIALLEQAANINKHLYGENKEYFNILFSLGHEYTNNQRFIDADSLYNEALDFYSPYVDSIEYAETVNSLLSNCSLQGWQYMLNKGIYMGNIQLLDKDSWFKTSMRPKVKEYMSYAQVAENTLLTYNRYADLESLYGSMHDLAVFYNDKKAQKTYLHKEFEAWRRWNCVKMNMMTKEEKQSFIEEWQTKKAVFLGDAMEYCPMVNDILYDLAIFSKGVLLQSERTLLNIIKENNDEEGLAIIESINTLRDRLHITKDVKEAISVNNELQSLERKLINISQQYSNYLHPFLVTWRDVQNSLKEGEIAIEFFKEVSNSYLLPKELQGKACYFALTITHNCEMPELTVLFAEGAVNLNLNNLAEYVWHPLLKQLKKANTVYFSPSGVLHLMPIEYAAQDIKKLSKKKFIRLSSTRELALKHDKMKFQKAVLFGGMNFDTAWDNADSHCTTPNVTQDCGNEAHDTQKSSVEENARKSLGKFKYLSGTLQEAANILQILQNENIESVSYTGDNGTEETFKKISDDNVNLIHIATHGFCSKAFSTNNEDEILNRCGLAFAGANTYQHDTVKSQNENNGILTAAEIARMDLRKSELVVLSACETGLGQLDADGVFGIQRGFKKAGARALLMSLWKVDDEATKILMTQFYENLFSKHLSPAEALFQAQIHLRTCNGALYDAPKYWAAFVLLDGLK